MTRKAQDEAQEILRELKSHTGGNAANQFEPMARFLVLITNDMDRQTRRIVRLTWALVILTAALLMLTFVLVKHG
jgi:hypothetical protein